VYKNDRILFEGQGHASRIVAGRLPLLTRTDTVRMVVGMKLSKALTLPYPADEESTDCKLDHTL
jgi:hypothetical protein